MLIVVTGSRSWPAQHNRVIVTALETCMRAASARDDVLTIRVGDARGVDRTVLLWGARAHEKGLAVAKPKVYRAKWLDPCIPGRCSSDHRRPDSRGTVCPLQGYVRNELMIDEDPHPDLLLAFIHAHSRGSTQCYEYAKKKGVDTHPIRC